jgi:surface-anchored protein
VDNRRKLISTGKKWVEGATVRVRNIAFAAIQLFLGLSIDAITKTPNYTITITPPSGALSLKSPLLIESYYTNTTSSDIYMDVTYCRICTADRILLKKDGKEVEPTPFQRMSTGRGLPSDFKDLPEVTASGHPERFHPGVFWKVNLDLRKLYNITEPGQYTLTATRTEETKDGKFEVNSNTVTLNIVP